MLRSYIKISLRGLRRHFGYSVINILGLTIGMTCCILILLYVQDELSYEKNHAQADQIYRLVTEATLGERQLSDARSSPAWGPTLVEDYAEVLDMVRMKTPNSRWLIKYGDKEFWERGFYFVDESIFDVFSFNFLRGDPSTALSEPNTVVITESAARRYFGSEDPMGKVFNGEDFIFPRVTGVVEDFDGNTHFHADFFTSMRTLVPTEEVNLYGNLFDADFASQGLSLTVYTYLLLQKDFPKDEFEAKIPGFVQTYLGARLSENGGELTPYLQPLSDIHLRSSLDGEIESNGDIAYVYTFSALALIIILIACINFMNLATACSANRAKEVGMRKVVGAYRGHLIQQFVGESMLLAVISLAFSIALVHLSLSWFNELAGKQMAIDYGSGLLVFGLIGITLVVGLLAGSYPAFFLSSFKPAAVLKGALKAGSTDVLVRKGLVVVQFSMAILMMVSTRTVFDQLNFIRDKNLGFDKEHIINIPLANINIANTYEAYKTAISGHPDVLGATGSSSLPGGLINTLQIRPMGGGEESTLSLQMLVADFEFVETMGIEMAAGRDFSRDHATDVENGVLLNETAAQAMGWVDPVGQEIEIGRLNSERTRTVVGVIKDFHLRSLHRKIEPLIIGLSEPLSLWYGSVRVSGNNLPETLDFLETTWHDTYAGIPYEYSFLDDDFDGQYRSEQQLQNVFGAFALFSILITCLGLFALASFTAEQRTKEVGVRKVMGASVLGLVLLLTKDFTRLVLLAFGPAAVLAYFIMNRWLDGFAYRIDFSFGSLLVAGLIALLITVLTVSYQSIKAALANPVTSLQYE